MKFRRHGVKREHSVIGAFATVYERLARLPGVTGVIPGRIANNPTHHPGLVLKGETPTGFKLLAKTTTSIQEVFVMIRGGARPEVLEGLRGVVTRPVAARHPQEGTHRADPPGRSGTGRPWHNPGILPEGRRAGDALRYSIDEQGHAAGLRNQEAWRPGSAPVSESLRDQSVRRRLLVLRLRRARWRHRFGTPRRGVPRPGRHG
jgi:hypothetical protein